MYNKTMGCLECPAQGFKTMCTWFYNHVQGQHFFADNSILCFFLNPHFFYGWLNFYFFIVLLGKKITTSPPHIILFYFGLLENLFPIIFTITIIFCFVRNEHCIISPHMVLKPYARPPTMMGCLGGLAHGLKTICKALLNHVQ